MPANRLKDPRPRHPRVQAILDAAPGDGGEAARWLADLVRASHKGAVEGVYHMMPSWAVAADGEIFAHVMPYLGHANLGFGHGAGLDDPDGLLEGSGRSHRFVRVAGPGAVPKSKLLPLLRQSLRIAKERSP